MSASWSGKVAVVTGAASGIGAALARRCASLGMHVHGADVDDAGLGALEREADGAASLATHHTDVRAETDVEALAEAAFDAHGHVHLFFNNAGVLVDGKSWERSAEEWRWNLDVNVMGVVHGIRQFVPRMLAQGEPGRVVNTASIGGLLGGGNFLGPYQASKHAVVAISETLYAELALEPGDVAASVLCPGDVATGIWQSQRLREPGERYALGSDAEQQFHDAVAGGVAGGISPDELARRAFEGIDAGRFWLLPQPDFKAMYELRVKSILEETNPLSTAELMERFSTR